MKFKSITTVAVLIAANLICSKGSAETQFNEAPCAHGFIMLYQYSEGGGKQLRACGAPSRLGEFNDKASSIRTDGRAVSLYSDTNFQGSCIIVTTRESMDGNFNSPPVFNLADAGFDDVTSSLRYGRDSGCRDATPPPFGGSLASLIKGIKSGNLFTVSFNNASRDMGTLKAGYAYWVTYSGGKFRTAGMNGGSNKVIAASYGNANPDENKISLWGRVYTFDASGNVYDPQFGLVGTLRFW
jgi:hypothetical protein